MDPKQGIDLTVVSIQRYTHLKKMEYRFYNTLVRTTKTISNNRVSILKWGFEAELPEYEREF